MTSNSQSFLGRYRLVKVLGQGAMGVVYEAVDTRLNRTVAIKTVLRSHLADETTASEYASRFEREAQAAARLSHPHVVTVYDFGEHEDISYIVMEFIRGRELNQAFEAGEKFPLPEAVRIMVELLKALDYAHQQGIVHRDVKPANVMLDPGGRVKLTDFGVARVANANQDRTMPGTLVGTPSYMSPEQILGTAVGSRTDIFAAGVILYQFLTGKRPFSGGGPFGVQRKIVQDDPDPPSRLNPDVPAGFDLIISRALAKQPENRYESAAAFAADLERIAATLQREVPLIDLDLPTESPPAPAPPPPAPAPAAGSSPVLTFGAAQPLGGAAAPPAAGAGDEPPFDPEATVIMFRPPTLDGHSRPPTLAGAPSPALSPRDASPPHTAGTSRTAPLPPAPAPSATRPAYAATQPMMREPTLRPTPPPAAPSAASRAAPPPSPAPPRATAAAVARAPARAARPLMPLAAGAGVAVLALATWLVVARPWATRVPSPTPAPPTLSPPTTPPAPPPAASQPEPTPAPALRPSPAEPTTGTSPSPAPSASPAVPPAPAPVPAPAAEPRSASPSPAAPRRAPTESGTTRGNPPPRAENPSPSGVAPRCGDLLQRMQLGEPLTAEQTAFFQSRCTR